MGRTNRDFIYLEGLRDYFARHEVLPSYANLSKALGFRSKNAAHKLAGRLIDAGYLQSGAGGRLAPGDRFFDRTSIADSVPAGVGEPAELSGAAGERAIDRMLIDRPSATVLVPVRGDSMCEAGILDGDTAVVEKTQSANSGDFVVALIDGRYTLKELRFEQGMPVLVPHNKNYAPIRPESEMSVVGVVRGIVRRYPFGRASAVRR